MVVIVNGPILIFRIVLLVGSFVLNCVAFRCHPCSCRKRRCWILPLFLTGNIVTLLLCIPDLVHAFGYQISSVRTNCSFNFIASNMLCSYFVTLGVLRLVLIAPGFFTYHRFFFASLIFTPLIAAGIQMLSSETELEEPLMMQLIIGKTPLNSKQANTIKIPLPTCAKNICGSADLVTTILSTIVPSLIPVVCFAVFMLVSFSIRRKFQENYRMDNNVSLMIPEFCDREQNVWPILKFVLVLVFGWTLFAKPITLLLTWLTRFYATSFDGEASVYVCANFWDVGNNVILFIAASVAPIFFIASHRPLCFCQKTEQSSETGSQRVFLDRPITVIGNGGFMDVGTFTWDTFHIRPNRLEEEKEAYTDKSVA